MNRSKFYRPLALTIIILANITQAQWFEKNNNLPPIWYAMAIDAYDSLIAIGPTIQDSLFITTNGGDRWESMFTPSSFGDISIIGSNKIWFINIDGEIYYTGDKGYNWQLQFYDPNKTQFMNYLEMFDSSNGIVMGDAPASNMPALFLKTTNGGEDWISQNDSSLLGLYSGDTWRRLDFIDENIGYFFSSNESPEKLYKTTNGAKSWRALIDSVGCQVVKFYDEFIGIIKAGECTGSQCIPGIHRTTDGGDTWDLPTTNNGGWGNDIEFIPGDPSKIWVITTHGGYYSNDMGNTWSEQFYDPDLKFIDLCFTDPNHGWLLAWPEDPWGKQRLFYTTNGGFGGIVSVNDEIEIPKGYFLSQNYPNPFNPTTKIIYKVPQTANVTLNVYDILGNEIATLVNEEKPAGSYEVEFSARGGGRNLASGIYFYQLKASNFYSTKKLILMK